MSLRHSTIHFLSKYQRYYQLMNLKLTSPKNVILVGGRCGFFGNLFITLHGIRLCEVARLSCAPLWGDECLYLESERGENAWDYYFQKPNTGLYKKEKFHFTKELKFKPNALTISPLYSNLNVRNSYHEIIKNQLHLHESISNKIQHFYETYFETKNVLGVHIRLTDAEVGFENRKTIKLDDYKSEIDSYLNQNPDSIVYVATDSDQALEEMKKFLSNKIIYNDCIRSPDQRSLHGHYDGDNFIKGSPYQKGLDVLLDSYLLSKCDYLIRVHSKVTTFSLTLNPDLKFSDLTYKKYNKMNESWLFCE